MIEIVINNFLNDHLSAPAFLEVQDNMPKRYVLFEKTGSGKKNQIPSSTFAFQSYGESLYEALKLNDELKQAVESMIALDEIGSIKLNSDYNFTDTTTKKHRYQAVFDIKHY